MERRRGRRKVEGKLISCELGALALPLLPYNLFPMESGRLPNYFRFFSPIPGKDVSLRGFPSRSFESI